MSVGKQPLMLLFALSFVLSAAHGFSVMTPSFHRQHSKTALFYTPQSESIDPSLIRYLGKGANALVRPGVVLIAPTEEYNHYLMRAAIFVYAMGLDEYDEYVIRCVVLDNPTPFTMAEMASLTGNLSGNLLYRGGNVGGETAMMLHAIGELKKEEIGTSGIYEGGLDGAFGDSQQKEYPETSFKFFFNYCQFSPEEMETMLEEVDTDTGDGWMSVEVPPTVVLEDWDKNDCWRFLRNVCKTRFINQNAEIDEDQEDDEDDDDPDPYSEM